MTTEKPVYITLGYVVPYISKTMGIERTRQTVHNWATKGVEMGLGRTIKLKTVKRVGIRYTTQAWVREFIEEASG